MKIKTTLKLIGLLPISLLFLTSSYFLYTSYEEYNKSEKLKTLLNNDEVLKELSLNIARERGLTGAYLGSKGTVGKKELRKQRLQTDRAIKKFYKTFKTKKASVDIIKLQQMLSKLKEQRAKVDALNVPFEEVFFDYYSKMNSHIFREFSKPLQYNLNPTITSLISNYIATMEKIEYSGQERGYVSKLLGSFAPLKDREVRTWLNLHSQAGKIKTNTLIDSQTKIAIEALLKKRQKVLEAADQARVEFIRGVNNGEFLVDPILWFKKMTDRISVLNTSANIIKQSLDKNIAAHFHQNLIQLIAAFSIWTLTLFLFWLGYSLSKRILTIKELEKVFDKVVNFAEFEEKVDLTTVSGTIKAYKAIEKAVEKIAKEKEKAEEANKAKSIFLANMSHEIRTPINGIGGFTEFWKNTPLNKEQRDFVEVIDKSSNNLLTIINNILDLSKIESNKIEIEDILFLPIHEFENAIEVYGPKAAEKNINLSFFMDPSLTHYLKGDPTKIKEVLINLMSNAVKFTPENGHIDVEIRKVSEEDDRVKVFFSVKDTGIGIPKEKMDHIFDAFSQADSTITRKYGGTGLGLTISYKFIELMGGELKVKSEEGKGSQFYFTLEFTKVPSKEKDYKNSFGFYKCAMLTPAVKQKEHVQYIYDYLKYFGVNVIFFSEFSEVNRLIETSGVNLLIIDYDIIYNEEIKNYESFKIPVLLILKSSYQSKTLHLNSKYIKPIYEPLNVTKLVKKLQECKPLIPKISTSKIDTKKEPAETNEKIEGDSFNASILVAEDNEINQKLIKLTLEDLGIKVDIANNGMLALAKRKSGNYDIIFMDIAMPVMDGIEATHKILEYEKENNLPHIPIVAVTANALKGDREKFLSEGLDEYITKPIKKSDILLILNMFLPKEKITHIKGEEQNKNSENLSDEESVIETEIVEKEEQKESKEKKMMDQNLLGTKEPSKEQTQEQIEQKDILVFKKSPIESKIFHKVLSTLNDSVDMAKDMKDFYNKIKTTNYKIIMIDKEIPDFSLADFRENLNTIEQEKGWDHTTILLFVDSDSKIDPTDKKYCDDILKNSANREYLQSLLDIYLAMQ